MDDIHEIKKKVLLELLSKVDTVPYIKHFDVKFTMVIYDKVMTDKLHLYCGDNKVATFDLSNA